MGVAATAGFIGGATTAGAATTGATIPLLGLSLRAPRLAAAVPAGCTGADAAGRGGGTVAAAGCSHGRRCCRRRDGGRCRIALCRERRIDRLGFKATGGLTTSIAGARFSASGACGAALVGAAAACGLPGGAGGCILGGRETLPGATTVVAVPAWRCRLPRRCGVAVCSGFFVLPRTAQRNSSWSCSSSRRRALCSRCGGMLALHQSGPRSISALTPLATIGVELRRQLGARRPYRALSPTLHSSRRRQAPRQEGCALSIPRGSSRTSLADC